jgi:hydrogenase maturation protease
VACPETRRVLVAGIGNVLRQDDGFGPAVIQALRAAGPLPPGVETMEMGIGCIALIHELMGGYDALIVVDAVDRGGPPGRLYVLDPDVPDPAEIPGMERWTWSNETCQTSAARALVMARAVGVLPPMVRFVGCQPAEMDEMSTELSPIVQRTVAEAVREILALIDGGEVPSGRYAG